MQCCAATAQSLHLTSVTGKTFFLEFACNLRSHCFGEGTRVEHFSDFGGFCSTLRAARAGFVGDGRTFSQFWMILFYSQGSAGRICRQRQNIFSILDDFVLLSEKRAPFLEAAVDKNQTFPPFFVYFQVRAPQFRRVKQTKKRHFPQFLSTFEAARTDFGVDGRQKSDIPTGFCLLSVQRAPFLEAVVDKNQTFPPVFVYFQVRAPQFRRVWQTKIRHFPQFLSTSRSAHPHFGVGGRQNSHISPNFCLLPGPRTQVCP